MQADAASGRLQLKDGGERLREGVSATAASLASALCALAQRGTADPPWPAACFLSSCLRFIDADGQVQVSVQLTTQLYLVVETIWARAA